MNEVEQPRALPVAHRSRPNFNREVGFRRIDAVRQIHVTRDVRRRKVARIPAGNGQSGAGERGAIAPDGRDRAANAVHHRSARGCRSRRIVERPAVGQTGHRGRNQCRDEGAVRQQSERPRQTGGFFHGRRKLLPQPPKHNYPFRGGWSAKQIPRGHQRLEAGHFDG